MKTLRSNFTLCLLVQIACAGLAVAPPAHGQSVSFVPLQSEQSQKSAQGKQADTILSGGDAAEVTAASVKKIPLSEAPVQLRKALGSGVLSAGGTK